MARVEIKSSAKRKAKSGTFPFTKTNYQILGVGILLIILGYLALGQEPWDGAMPLVIAPILLVIGYCVAIPLGILYRGKADQQPHEAAAPVEPQA